ncbi:hypothetical protein QM291_30680, partial [Pseudomonas aeruginosa]|nr:hypothetical protein [Pseudomonas aeruginosa]
FRLARAGRFAEAMPIYEWLMPILHLDARPDLVQCIKLCEELAGRGSALTRPPRLALRGAGYKPTSGSAAPSPPRSPGSGRREPAAEHSVHRPQGGPMPSILGHNYVGGA